MLSSQDIDMSLLYLRSPPIDHIIPSPGELLYNRKLVSNLSANYIHNNARKEEIWDRLLQRQLTQKKQHDKHAKDLPRLNTVQLVRVKDQNKRNWTPTIVRQACPELRSYIIETLIEVLRRNRRQLKEDCSNSDKTLTALLKTSRHHTKHPPLKLQTHIPAKDPAHMSTSVYHLE